MKALVYLSIVAVWTIAQAAGSCAPRPSQVSGALDALSLRDPNLGGWPWFECGYGDEFAQEFEATTPSGQRISGAVCCGIFKGCTVRFE